MSLSESDDDEAELNDLRLLEEAVLEDESTEPKTDISKLTPEKQKTYKLLCLASELNKKLSEKVTKFENLLIVRLKECRGRLVTLQAETNEHLTEKPQTFRYVTCGKPYFKDREYYPPPDNEDTITMKTAGMLDFCEIQSVPGWTLKDKSQFLEQVLIMSRKIRKSELISKLAELKRKSKTEDSTKIAKDKAKLKKDIENVKKLPLEAVVKPINEEYDWEAIADILNHKHSPPEYRSIWKLFLHPLINKKGWTRSEHSKLQEIVNSFQMQDWDEIAKALDTGRTGYQCFVYFRSLMGNTLTGAKWSKEEEEYLSRLIEYYKEDDYIPWGKVAASMENRTKIQIYNKYFRMNELRKGRFLPEEDAVLLSCVENFGKEWKKISNFLPGRSSNQVRIRYHVLINNSTRASVVWTVDEDKKLIQLTKEQNSVIINYADMTKFFPGKDRAQLRARYVTLSRWIKRHPDKDISTAPRRGPRRLIKGYSNKNLNLAVENLKKRIQSDVENFKGKKINKNSPEEAIEHAIVTTLITESIREEAIKKQTIESEIKDSNDRNTATVNEKNLRNILILLKAKLKKDLFKCSKYYMQYPNLEKEEQTNVIKLKSYSKKASTSVIPMNSFGSPVDIWGNPLLKTDSVLPPNYSTITGCRRLMALAMDTKPVPDNQINLAQIMRRNSLVKEQIDLFMERFTTLFLWPMLLSNENPEKYNFCKPKITTNLPSFKQEYPINSQIPNVFMSPKPSTSTAEDDNIDFNGSNDKKGDIVVKTYIGNDDFMYMNYSSEEECPEDVPEMQKPVNSV